MALQNISGGGMLFPSYPFVVGTISMGNGTFGPIDATGEKIAFIGRVWFPALSGSKSIRYIGFRFGTVVKAGGSGLTVSLQDVTTTTGPPGQPDGTQDQTVAIANGNASFASSTWIRTGALSADRTVNFGDRLAVVIEYDGSGRLGSDSVYLGGISGAGASSSATPGEGFVSLYTSSWASIGGVIGNVILEFTDGTFGTLYNYMPGSDTTAAGFNQSTGGADEYGAVIRVPFPCKVSGLWAMVDPDGDFDLVLYSGTTALATASVDANTVVTNQGRSFICPIAEQTLTANTDYIVSVKPTTTTTITVYSLVVNDANHLSVYSGGVNCNQVTRLDLGSWSAPVTTSRLMAGIVISALDDGAGASGGLLTHPGMVGGMRG